MRNEFRDERLSLAHLLETPVLLFPEGVYPGLEPLAVLFVVKIVAPFHAGGGERTDPDRYLGNPATKELPEAPHAFGIMNGRVDHIMYLVADNGEYGRDTRGSGEKKVLVRRILFRMFGLGESCTFHEVHEGDGHRFEFFARSAGGFDVFAFEVGVLFYEFFRISFHDRII